ncbi:TetR/AcrR family transcriptional regulator, partial [Veillonella dispar]|nr:TetR/AcrR family transcriptional regulator [Veillonella dispar]
RLLGALAPEPLCAFVWGSMLSSIKRGDPRCETLFALLRRTLYEPPFA